MRGNLILIEGLDRSGKSTQAAILKHKINDCIDLKFPDRTTKIGNIINDYLTDDTFQLPDQAIHLLFSANRWELYDKIIADLNSGKTIILDRYIYSGIAYSLSKLSVSNGQNEMSDINWLYGPDKGLPKPDLTLFLTLDLTEIQQRSEFGKERYENLQFQKLVKSNFLQLLDTNDSTIKLVNVNGKSINQVESQIWEIIENGKFNKLTENPIQFLT